MMLRPDPTGFTASNTILGELAHQLRPCAGCSSAQSDDQLDTVGVMNGSVLIEALSDGVSLSPTEAQRCFRELLAVCDPSHADLYEKVEWSWRKVITHSAGPRPKCATGEKTCRPFTRAIRAAIS
jgi:hypothetical protein